MENEGYIFVIKIYNKKIFVLGIGYFLQSLLVIYISLKDFDIKLLIISLILLVCSCVCTILSFSEKAYQKKISALQAEKELEETNRALKVLNSVGNISSTIGTFFASISLVILIIALIAIIKK